MFFLMSICLQFTLSKISVRPNCTFTEALDEHSAHPGPTGLLESRAEEKRACGLDFCAFETEVSLRILKKILFHASMP